MRGQGHHGAQQRRSLRTGAAAYEDAGLSPAVLTFWNAMVRELRSATQLNWSRSAACAAKRILEYWPKALPIGSSKAMVGHLKMAAGAVGLMRAILALNSRVVPPQVTSRSQNPSFDWDTAPSGASPP